MVAPWSEKIWSQRTQQAGVCEILPFTLAYQDSKLPPKNGEGIAAVVGGTNHLHTMALV